jgi:Ca2+-binding EF-hand superfamily protein
MKQFRGTVTKEEISRLIEKIDKNNDGRIEMNGM